MKINLDCPLLAFVKRDMTQSKLITNAFVKIKRACKLS